MLKNVEIGPGPACVALPLRVASAGADRRENRYCWGYRESGGGAEDAMKGAYCPAFHLTAPGVAAMVPPHSDYLSIDRPAGRGMNRRDWMRLVVPGLCVALLPACIHRSSNARNEAPFTGQAAAPAPGQKPLRLFPNPSQRGFETTQRTGTPAQLTLFASGPAWTPYNIIQHADIAPTQSAASLIGTTAPEADPNVGPAAQGDRFLDLATNKKASTGPEPSPPAAKRESKKPIAEPTNDSKPPESVPPTLITEPPLLAAVRSCWEKRPEEFHESLSQLDSGRRDLLLALIPLTVRIGEGDLARSNPREIAEIVDHLQGLVLMLRPRAALVLDKFCFCRYIRKFGEFQPLADKPAFHPGEMVEVYAEIRNVSSMPHRSNNGDFRTHLHSKIQVRNSAGKVIDSNGWDKPDDTLTPQHDYFQHFRFQIPDEQPGTYTIHLEARDVPTGRKVQQKLEFQIVSP